jgi:hypothetical protein
VSIRHVAYGTSWSKGKLIVVASIVWFVVVLIILLLIGSVVRWLAAGGAFILQAFALLRRAAGRQYLIMLLDVVGWMARDFFLNESEDLLCGGK